MKITKDIFKVQAKKRTLAFNVIEGLKVALAKYNTYPKGKKIVRNLTMNIGVDELLYPITINFVFNVGTYIFKEKKFRFDKTKLIDIKYNKRLFKQLDKILVG